MAIKDRDGERELTSSHTHRLTGSQAHIQIRTTSDKHQAAEGAEGDINTQPPSPSYLSLAHGRHQPQVSREISPTGDEHLAVEGVEGEPPCPMGVRHVVDDGVLGSPHVPQADAGVVAARPLDENNPKEMK